MFINPKVAISEGWITGIKNPDKQIQPNAIDFTLDHLLFVNDNTFVISEEGKQMRGNVDYPPVQNRQSGLYFWRLDPHSVYDGMSSMYVDVPEGVAAMLVTRSSFTRNGIFIMSGLYDTGFQGHIGFTVHNRMGASAMIGQGTRIGQIIFVESHNSSVYAGGWNHEQGTHYSEKG